MKLRTLVVDDEALARQKLLLFLDAEPDVEVVGECSDGNQAVQAIGSLTPDLVFLDVEMPRLDGFGVLEALGEGQSPFVIFVTAYGQFAGRAAALKALDYLVKPFSRDRFEDALARARARISLTRDRDAEADPKPN